MITGKARAPQRSLRRREQCARKRFGKSTAAKYMCLVPARNSTVLASTLLSSRFDRFTAAYCPSRANHWLDRARHRQQSSYCRTPRFERERTSLDSQLSHSRNEMPDIGSADTQSSSTMRGTLASGTRISTRSQFPRSSKS